LGGGIKGGGLLLSFLINITLFLKNNIMKILKKLIVLILISQIFLFDLSFVNAENTIKITTSQSSNRDATRAEVFSFLSNYLLSNLPKSYEYIDLKYTDVKKWTKLYSNLQKLVYVDALPNKELKINSLNKMSSFEFYNILKSVSWLNFINDENKTSLKLKNVTVKDFLVVNAIISNVKTENTSSNNSLNLNLSDEENKKFQILLDVYSILLSWHYDSKIFQKDSLIYSAIEWLANWTWDQYTTFFPPVEAINFSESLAWEFEWIWAYIDMETPWVLKIVSPLSGSPAEKAWLKWWDIVLKVDEKEITKTMWVNEAVSYIKWPAWTEVKLTILRWKETFEIKVTREKIVIHDVETKVIDGTVFYIKIRMFWDKVFTEFQNALEELEKTPWITKVVIDLRNNPGGYLDKVTNMLSYFVPKWEPTAVVKYPAWEYKYYSYWYAWPDTKKYSFYLMWNSWTASASEIMIWTLKDYFPEMTFVWEKTYWKWSVQTIKDYYDGSSLKYTIARWYTWKNEIWIDKVWIKPDVDLPLDQTWALEGKDNQLQYILSK